MYNLLVDTAHVLSGQGKSRGDTLSTCIGYQGSQLCRILTGHEELVVRDRPELVLFMQIRACDLLGCLFHAVAMPTSMPMPRHSQ